MPKTTSYEVLRIDYHLLILFYHRLSCCIYTKVREGIIITIVLRIIMVYIHIILLYEGNGVLDLGVPVAENVPCAAEHYYCCDLLVLVVNIILSYIRYSHTTEYVRNTK